MKVAFQLLLDTRHLKNPLDPQHLLDLVLNCLAVLEIKCCRRADMDLAVSLVSEHTRPDVGTVACIVFKLVKIVAGKFFHRCSRSVWLRRNGA